MLVIYARYKTHSDISLDERIEEHDSLVLEKSIQVSIGMCGSLRAFNDVEFCQRKAYLGSKSFNSRFQRPILQRRVFVKERSNQNRINGHEEHEDDETEAPEPNEEILSTSLRENKQTPFKSIHKFCITERYFNVRNIEDYPI